MRNHSRPSRIIQPRYKRWQRVLSMGLMAYMTAALLMIPAAARSTYVIHDGGDVIVHTTFSRNVRQVLREAGVELGHSDTYTTREEGNQLELTVQRRQSIRVWADDQLHIVETFGETVGEVLDALGIVLGPEDRVSEPLTAATATGMTVVVTRVTREQITTEEVVPAEEQVYLNTVLRPGEETVLQQGSDGSRRVTTEIVYEDGQEVSRAVVQETVLVPATERIVIRGAEAASMPADAEGDAILTAGGEVLEYEYVIDGMATAYNCPGYVGHTASGTVAEVGKVAVDPRVIPLGTKLYIVSQDGQYVYGYCIAEDTGGLIKGNKVDLYFDTWDECIQFGYRPVTIYVLE